MAKCIIKGRQPVSTVQICSDTSNLPFIKSLVTGFHLHIQICSVTVLHFFNVSSRRDFQKHLERIRFGEEITDSVLILQFVSKVLESHNTCLQRTSINLGDQHMLVYRKPAKIKIIQKQIFPSVFMNIKKRKCQLFCVLFCVVFFFTSNFSPLLIIANSVIFFSQFNY